MSLMLVLRAFWELSRYEVLSAVFGFRRLHRQVARTSVKLLTRNAPNSLEICEAVTLAACFYWKPVRCLQRSSVIVRMLRRSGVNARLVIGYCPSPFAAHAWVEVNGRVINDSPAYKEQMQVLYTA